MIIWNAVVRAHHLVFCGLFVCCLSPRLARAEDTARRMPDGSLLTLAGAFLRPERGDHLPQGSNPDADALTLWTTHTELRTEASTRAVLLDAEGREYRLTYAGGVINGGQPEVWDEEWVLLAPPPPGRSLRLRVSLQGDAERSIEFPVPYPEDQRTRQYAARASNQLMAEAVHRCDLGLMYALLERGAHANVRDRDGFTPLMIAATFGDLPLASTLLDRGAARDTRTTAGGTALFYAIFRNDPALVELLLSRGADPNLPGIQDTPLGWSKRRGNAAIIKLLVRYGARSRRAA